MSCGIEFQLMKCDLYVNRLNQAVNDGVAKDDKAAHQTIESVLKKVVRRAYSEESPLRVKFSGK